MKPQVYYRDHTLLNIPKPFVIRSRESDWPSRKTQSTEWLGIFAWILGPVSKRPLETFCQAKLKICGNEYSLSTHFSPVQHSIYKPDLLDLQCKPNDCFYVKYSNRLKYNNTIPFLLNNYLLKCAQHMLDIFLLKIHQFTIKYL